MRRYLRLVCVLGLLAADISCKLPIRPPPPNTVVDVTIVNDKPSTTATVNMCLCGRSTFAGTCPNFFVPIDATGKGFFRFDTQDTCPVPFFVVCGSGKLIQDPNFVFSPSSDAKRTVNCGFTTPLPASTGWRSFGDSLKMLHLDVAPSEYSSVAAAQADSSALDPSIDANRESVARSFLGEYGTNVRQADVLYDLLLGAAPPDGTVLQNLQLGQSSESQIVYIVAGQQFFADSNNDNTTFVTRVYQRLLNRNPSQWELNSAVAELNGFWIFVDEPCPLLKAFLCTPDGFCMQQPPSCGHWEWFQITRDDFAWQIVGSHEFGQVVAGFMYGIQLRRPLTATELEDQAYYIGTYGLKEGAVRPLKTLEFFGKSAQPW